MSDQKCCPDCRPKSAPHPCLCHQIAAIVEAHKDDPKGIIMSRSQYRLIKRLAKRSDLLS